MSIEYLFYDVVGGVNLERSRVDKSVHVYMCTHNCTRTCIYIYTPTPVSRHTHTHTQTFACTCTCTCICVRIRICMRTYHREISSWERMPFHASGWGTPPSPSPLKRGEGEKPILGLGGVGKTPPFTLELRGGNPASLHLWRQPGEGAPHPPGPPPHVRSLAENNEYKRWHQFLNGKQ